MIILNILHFLFSFLVILCCVFIVFGLFLLIFRPDAFMLYVIFFIDWLKHIHGKLLHKKQSFEYGRKK